MSRPLIALHLITLFGAAAAFVTHPALFLFVAACAAMTVHLHRQEQRRG